MAKSSGPAQAPRWPLPWLEIVLPAYAVVLVMVYYRPDSFHLAIADDRIQSIVAWSLRVLGWALGGVLAVSGLLLAFYLLYSPVYLARNFPRALDPGVWVDPRELRFYFCCFGLLCALIVLAIWEPELALVAFTILAGSAQLLWRLLV